MTPVSGDDNPTIPLVRKIAWTVSTGLLAFAGSALLDRVLQVSLADQLILTFITGGVTLLVQYLGDFEERLRLTREQQRRTLEELRQSMHHEFAAINEATVLMDAIDRSALNKDTLKLAIRRAGRITATTRPLARRLADTEIERLSGTLQSLADGHEYFYDGEDRELLLALARNVETSIKATSWATTGVAGPQFEAGFWFSDIGGRYLDLQRRAIEQGVSVQRIFLCESAEQISNESLQRVFDMQLTVGVDVRVLIGDQLRPGEPKPDYVLFDEEICHDSTPIARGGSPSAPWLLTTRLIFDEHVVRRRAARFAELWEIAGPSTPPSPESHE